jgi:hypothetical protein
MQPYKSKFTETFEGESESALMSLEAAVSFKYKGSKVKVFNPSNEGKSNIGISMEGTLIHGSAANDSFVGVNSGKAHLWIYYRAIQEVNFTAVGFDIKTTDGYMFRFSIEDYRGI